jgi:hypothetical protein
MGADTRSKGIWSSAFRSESMSYGARVNQRTEFEYNLSLSSVGMATNSESADVSSPVKIKSDAYILTVSGGESEKALAEVARFYRNEMTDVTGLQLVETTHRFLWIPWRSYKLELKDGTNIPVSDVTWFDPSDEL